MKVTEHINNAKGKTLFTIEILPPLKGENIKVLFDNMDPLMEFKPRLLMSLIIAKNMYIAKRVGDY
jgi:hypothetical protein